MNRNVPFAQLANATHGHAMGTFAVAEATMAVVNVLRTVHTDANNNVVTFEAVTPFVIDQCGIGLNMLFNDHALILELRRLLVDQ